MIEDFEVMVPRGGIEPPTRGFSIRSDGRPARRSRPLTPQPPHTGRRPIGPRPARIGTCPDYSGGRTAGLARR